MKIIKWAEAIKEFEGWKPGSRSYRTNNQGNLRYTSYTKSLGAIGKDAGNFCIFSDEQAGFDALCQFLTDAAGRKLKPYHVFSFAIAYHRKMMPEGKNGDELPDFSIRDFFHIYAPSSDSNNPHIYASFVAGKLGVEPEYLIKDLLE